MGADLAIRLGMLARKVRRWPAVLWRWEAQLKGIEFRGKCDFDGRPILSRAKDGSICIGEGARLFSSPRSTSLGSFQPCVIRALCAGAKVIIGPGVGLSATVVCAGKSIEI